MKLALIYSSGDDVDGESLFLLLLLTSFLMGEISTEAETLTSLIGTSFEI